MGAKVRNPSQILAVWLGFQLLSWAAVPGSAVDVYTPAELFVENGTDGTLRCTFTSKELVSSGTSLSWDFHPEGGGDAVSLFHYTGGKPYFGKTPQFKNRVLWVGDLNKKDASITITKMIFKDNGTYSCIVKNPPDIDVKPSSIHLQVVERGSLPLSNAGVIAGAVIGAILGLLIILVIVFYLLVRRKQASKDYIGCSSSECVVPQETRALKKEGSNKEDSRCSSPSGPAQVCTSVLLQIRIGQSRELVQSAETDSAPWEQWQIQHSFGQVNPGPYFNQDQKIQLAIEWAQDRGWESLLYTEWCGYGMGYQVMLMLNHWDPLTRLDKVLRSVSY